jgi:GntR family transcriptional regulator, transcriptional repressor for pyruvate dehydrogenase complex
LDSTEKAAMFEEVRQSTVTQKIISQIRTAVLKGKLQPGDKLPSEKEMVEQFQVSKQSLREAIRALEHIGLVVVKKGIGGGAFIVEVDPEIVKESLTNYLYFKSLSIENLSEFRKLIEPYAAAKVAENINAKQLQELNALNHSAVDHLKNDRIVEAGQDELDFHRFIARETNNPLLYLIVDFTESMLEDFKRLFLPDKAFYKEVFEFHDRIFEAIRDRDGQRASAEMLAHIEQVARELLVLKEDMNIKQIYVKSA